MCQIIKRVLHLSSNKNNENTCKFEPVMKMFLHPSTINNNNFKNRLRTVVLLLFVISFTAAVTTTLPFVSAKKEVFIPKPIKEAIPLVRCSVCEHTMFQLVRNTLDYISDNGVKHKLKEEKLIDKVFDPVCAPLRTGGSWLRGADWEIHQDTTSGQMISSAEELTANTVFQFKLRDTHSGEKSFKCGTRCATAAAACDLIMRSPSASDDVVGRITSIFMKHFPKLLKAVEKEEQDQRLVSGKVDLDEVKIDADPEKEMVDLAKILVLQICRKKLRISGCSPSTKKKHGSSNNNQMIPAQVLHAEPIEEMELKEVEVEEMMFRMKYGFKDGNNNNNNKNKKRGYESDDNDDDEGGIGSAGNPGLDVYGRDEMLRLREAIKKGDREVLRELDPQSDELSDEELEMLSGMHKKEFGGN